MNYKERKSYKKIGFLRKNHTRKNQSQNKREMFGGSVIASGGFGCIFKPSIKCESNSPSNDSISKLMLKKNAKHEYNEIQKYKDKAIENKYKLKYTPFPTAKDKFAF